MFEISLNRYLRPTYIEALYNSIEMIFNKLEGDNFPITITEVEDESETEKSISKTERVTLESSKEGTQTFKITN